MDIKPNSYTREITVSNTPCAAYKALTSGFYEWWTPGSNVLNVVGDTITFKFGPAYWVMRANSIASDYIELECIEAHHIHGWITISNSQRVGRNKAQMDNSKTGRKHENILNP